MVKKKGVKQEEAQAAASQDGFLLDLHVLYGDNLPADYFVPALELNQVLLKSMAHYERFAKQHKLNFNSLLVLMVISYSKEPCNQHFISKTLWLPKQTVGSILLGLKKKGLIEEAASSTDARAKVLSLTSEGSRFCEGIFTELHNLEIEALQKVEVEDIKAATRSLEAYSEAFGQGLEDLSENRA